MKRIYLMVIVLIVLSNCTSLNKQTIEVLDVSKLIEISEKKLDGVYSLELEITGSVNGKARIRLYNIKEEIVENKFVFNYHADWYSNSAIITYEPIESNFGTLKIKYKFYSL